MSVVLSIEMALIQFAQVSRREQFNYYRYTLGTKLSLKLYPAVAVAIIARSYVASHNRRWYSVKLTLDQIIFLQKIHD